MEEQLLRKNVCKRLTVVMGCEFESKEKRTIIKKGRKAELMEMEWSVDWRFS